MRTQEEASCVRFFCVCAASVIVIGVYTDSYVGSSDMCLIVLRKLSNRTAKAMLS